MNEIAPADPVHHRIVLVTGMSGAGRASILRALEDIGYEAIDNPPLELVEDMVSRDHVAEPRWVAVGLDVRSRGFDPDQVLAARQRLRRNPLLEADLVFAAADEAVLLRRFTETRRRHPMAPTGRVTDGIAAEQRLMGPLHEAADLVIDTSDLKLAGLRQLIERHFGAESKNDPQTGLAVSLVSFAFPAGLPREADLVFDSRFLRNPYYDLSLRPLNGTDPAVAAYVEADPDFVAFFGRIVGLLELLLPRFVQEGKKYATVAVGCTGGWHRSVTIVERLALFLTQAGWRVTTTHRELIRDDMLARQQAARSVQPGQDHAAPAGRAREA